MSESLLSTPVVFLVFNRPDTTQKVFEVIRQAKPKKLLVVADGPRQDKPEEAEKCKAVRSIIDTVDWDCEVLKNYSDVNLGSYKRNSSGLTWAFNNVEEAIILEDDCVPDLSFFRFCEELLDYYRHDKRIMMISGNNFQFGRKRTNYSYYFSQYSHIWGWATWKRTWKTIDLEMKNWPEFRDYLGLESILNNYFSRRYWYKLFQNMYLRKRRLAWDYQLQLACYMQNGLSIIPHVNLVSNIGFSLNATNTKNLNSPFANMPKKAIKFPLKHPPFVVPNKQADDFTHTIKFGLLLRGYRKIRQLIAI